MTDPPASQLMRSAGRVLTASRRSVERGAGRVPWRLQAPEPCTNTSRACGSRPAAIVIDVGCGQGEQAVQLSRRCRPEGHRYRPSPAMRAGSRAQTAQPGDTVSFEVGAAEDLPIASASADLVSVPRRPVPRPGPASRLPRIPPRAQARRPAALVYHDVALTSLLEPKEAAFLLPVMGCAAAAMRPENTEAAINDAGLRVDLVLILLGTVARGERCPWSTRSSRAAACCTPHG